MRLFTSDDMHIYDIQGRLRAQFRLVYVFGPDKRTTRRIRRLRKLYRAISLRRGWYSRYTQDAYRAWLARGYTSICQPVKGVSHA